MRVSTRYGVPPAVATDTVLLAEGVTVGEGLDVTLPVRVPETVRVAETERVAEVVAENDREEVRVAVWEVTAATSQWSTVNCTSTGSIFS